MKKRTIHRPHWKRIAKAAQRKLSEARRELRFKKPTGRAFGLIPPITSEPEQPRKMTAKQEKWYNEGYREGRGVGEVEREELKARNSDFARRSYQQQQRREFLKPALELINKLMED